MREVRIGLIGYKFMGKAHTQGFKDLPIFYETGITPLMKVICGRHKEAVKHAAQQYGWDEYETDWRKVVSRKDIDLIDIITPNDTHKEIVVAAAEAGKDIICEKPLARNLAEAQEMLRAVEKAGVKHMVAFCNRCVPAIALARELIKEGKLGRIYHWRGSWIADWCIDPKSPLVWRLQRDIAGSGALGDIGSHMVDLARYLVGEIDSVIGITETFIKERSLLDDPDRIGKVDVDDACLFLARFESGALGSFEVTRVATGNKERYGFEINGSKGSLRFNYNHMDELYYFSRQDQPKEQGFRTIFLGGDKDHPYVGTKWGWGGGHGESGYGDLFTFQAYELMKAIANDTMPSPNFQDGVRCQAVLEAVGKSVEEGHWIKIKELMA